MAKKMGLTFLELITIMVAGTMAGNEFCVMIVNTRLSKLEDRAHFDSARTLAAVFGTVMPFWYAATLLLTGVVAFRLRGAGTAAVLVDASASLWLLSIVYTITCLVPINSRIAAWQWGTRPSEWTHARQKWDALHTARVALLVLALACLVLACLLTRIGR